MRGALGLEKDEEKAMARYTKAAVQGHSKAQYQLGLCFERGVGTTREPAEAAKWYKLAAEQGHAGGLVHSSFLLLLSFFFLFFFSLMYLSHEEAFFLLLIGLRYVIFFACTSAFSADAQHNLGRAYETGMGVAKDLTAAHGWCVRSYTSISISFLSNILLVLPHTQKGTK